MLLSLNPLSGPEKGLTNATSYFPRQDSIPSCTPSGGPKKGHFLIPHPIGLGKALPPLTLAVLYLSPLLSPC